MNTRRKIWLRGLTFGSALGLTLGIAIAANEGAWAQTPPASAADPLAAPWAEPTPAPGAAPAAPGGDNRGQVRVQGVPVVPQAPPIGAPVLGKLTDFREEMRKLITEIANFARKTQPGFVVMTHNGLELLEKVDEADQRKAFPARGYMLSIDAIMQDGLFYGNQAFGKPPEKDTADMLKHFTDLAERNRIRLLTMDFTNDRKAIDRVLQESARKGYLPFVAQKPINEMNALPTYPSRPFRENGNHVLSMDSAKNYVYLRDTTAFGLEVEFALKMHDTNFDMVIVDVFHGRKPFSKRAIETMKYKKLGSKRLVLARMDIGTAASYRYYWKAGWQSGSPRWITAPYPTDPDRFFVEYWRPEWHKLIYGDAKSFTYGLIAQGYDGVLLETVDAYHYFESGGQNLTAFK
ncbi:MAG: hypothetical protein VW268_11485 [Rhodospirillaceae bacterium]